MLLMHITSYNPHLSEACRGGRCLALHLETAHEPYAFYLGAYMLLQRTAGVNLPPSDNHHTLILHQNQRQRQWWLPSLHRPLREGDHRLDTSGGGKVGVAGHAVQLAICRLTEKD